MVGGLFGIKEKRSLCKEKCARGKEVFCERASGFRHSHSSVDGIKCDSYIFALTAEKDETPQCIEIRFVDEIAN